MFVGFVVVGLGKCQPLKVVSCICMVCSPFPSTQLLCSQILNAIIYYIILNFKYSREENIVLVGWEVFYYIKIINLHLKVILVQENIVLQIQSHLQKMNSFEVLVQLTLEVCN